MKKILLFMGAFVALNASAQFYEANDSAAFSAWTPYDLDTDGNDFSAVDFSGGTNTYFNAQGGMAVSESWNAAGGAYDPDNLFVSPVLDLSTASAVTVNWTAGTGENTADGFYGEKYSVYVVTNVAQIIAGTFPTPIHTETLSAGQTAFSQSIDISASAAGQSAVYIIVRHYESNDIHWFCFDDMSITGDFASVQENTLTAVNAFPNPATDVLNISTNEPVASVKVMTLDGKVIVNNTSVNSSFIDLNVNDLEAGMYVYEVATAEGKIFRDSFIKQ